MNVHECSGNGKVKKEQSLLGDPPPNEWSKSFCPDSSLMLPNGQCINGAATYVRTMHMHDACHPIPVTSPHLPVKHGDNDFDFWMLLYTSNIFYSTILNAWFNLDFYHLNSYYYKMLMRILHGWTGRCTNAKWERNYRGGADGYEIVRELSMVKPYNFYKIYSQYI